MKMISICDTHVVAEHDGMVFHIIMDALWYDEDYIGFYIDKDIQRQRVVMDSLYGEHITKMMKEYYKGLQDDLGEIIATFNKCGN